MKIAYFDCFSGVSGDMALGALVDCGVPVEALRAGLGALDVCDWEIETEPVLRGGIHAMDVTVRHQGRTDADEHAGHHHPGRSMRNISALISDSGLSERVKSISLAVFERIALAEGHLHHKAPQDVHFHEIGGLDSILDICGVAWCLEHLNVEQIFCSALPYSTGFVDCAHGRMPVPAPATLEILRGVPMVPVQAIGEMVTPTGAALVATLAHSFGPPPALRPERTGYGSGKREFKGRPNLLRVILGETAEAAPTADGLEWRDLVLLRSNIDDMNPEFYDYVCGKMFEGGALDVWLEPIQMKKGRPAQQLSVLCGPEQQDALLRELLRETTTLGVRVETLKRAALPRRSLDVETRFGLIRVKVAEWPEGQLARAAPEYADVARLAAEQGVPAMEVHQAALVAFARQDIK